MKNEQVVKTYIHKKKMLTYCMQNNLRQVCHNCRFYARCNTYKEYVNAWFELQKEYKN